MGKRRTSGLRRRGCLVFVALAAVIGLLFGHAAFHLIGVAWRDSGKLQPAPVGFVDDASRMNMTAVAEAVEVSADPVEAEQQLVALLARCRAEGLKVAIAGARHTMGGHTIYPGGVVIDMETFNRFSLDESTDVLHAQAGARWDQIVPYLNHRGRSIRIMQSNNSFTVGGSVSANCHGWQPNCPPIASSVERFRLLKADGEIVRCSRTENAEIFSLALGGYGLFGVILDVDLNVVANERYRCERLVKPADEFVQEFDREVRRKAGAGMAYGRLRVTADHFLEEAVLNVFRRVDGDKTDAPDLTGPSMAGLKRTIFRGSEESEYGKQLRWDAEKLLSDHLTSEFFWRNELLNDGASLYQNRSETSTDILHEYFVPGKQLSAFLGRVRTIVPRYKGDLLNVTVRQVLEDHDSYLRYADREMFSLVMLFTQARTEAADANMQAMTQEMIDVALEFSGRHYLPYRLHATVEQFARAYPQGRDFFEKKRQYDPQELFQNQFYLKYGKRE